MVGTCIYASLCMKCTVLVVDDENAIAQDLAELLEFYEFRAVTASSVNDAMLRLKSIHIDVVVCDVVMPLENGMALQRYMQSKLEYRNIPFIYMTGQEFASESLKDNVLPKPFNADHLIQVVRLVLETSQHTECES